MKRRFNNNGFTLIELLISLVIIGIILGLALPQVSRLQSANRLRKYDTYKDSLESAAKLYVENHSIDLFGNNEKGCVTIPYSALKRDNLIRDFGEEGIVCSNDSETFVDVTKNGEDYIYSSDLVCYNGSNVAYKNQDTADVNQTVCGNHSGGGGGEGGEDEEDIPYEFDNNAPVLALNPTNSGNKWYNAEDIVDKLELSAIVSDDTGLNRNITVLLSWKRLSDNSTKTYSFSFNNKTIVREKIKISKILTKNVVPSDSADTGKYMLTISPNNTRGDSYGVQDNLGNYSKASASEKEYWIDNQDPTMNPKVTSSDSDFNSVKVNIKINGSDAHAGLDKVYISNTGYEKGGSWQNYKTSDYSWTLSGSYDGKERSIYITLMDKAGNKVNKTVKYTVYEGCDETTSTVTKTSDCSKTCGGGEATQTISLKDKHTGSSCGTTTKKVSCNNQACISTEAGCHIRGNTCRTGGYDWTCNGPAGQHTKSYFYQIYCIDSNGKISMHDESGDFACGYAPYGPDNDWVVIDDSSIGSYSRKGYQKITTTTGCNTTGNSSAVKVDKIDIGDRTLYS